MSIQRYAKQADTWLQQIIQTTCGIHLDQQINGQKYVQLGKKQPAIATSLISLYERKMASSKKLHELHRLSQELQEKLQRRFGAEPNYPVELSTETSLLK